MLEVLYSGHKHGSGLKALLELFCGPADASVNRFEGKTLNGWKTRSNSADVILLSCLTDEKASVFTLCTDDQGLLTIGSAVEEAPRETDPRRQIKRQLYRALSGITGIEWPWGSLTGIRPTYVAGELLNGGLSAEQVELALRQDYNVSKAKAELAVAAAAAEEEILQTLPPDAYAVYVGVPFCPTRCSYCSFTTQEGIGSAARLGDAYLDRLEAEVEDYLHWQSETELGSLMAVYVGGGTPAALDDWQFRRLLQIIRRLPAAANCEWTVEAGRADVVTEAKLQALCNAGIKRICLNPQTMSEVTQGRIGRRTAPGQFQQVYASARRNGQDIVNMDLIAGLPGEGAEDLLNSTREVLDLAPEAITLHTLAMKRGSEQSNSVQTGTADWRALPQLALAAGLQRAQELLRSRGYRPYYLYRQHYALGGLENVSFARPGAETIYNVMMMSDRCSIVSFGSPAVSKRVKGKQAVRLGAPKSLRAYLDGGETFFERKRSLFSPHYLE